uniref:Uncharacterized protein n=1 Tax=Romanomermis culicivorax TaxID=13658 RepID=A0A915KER4_ROMCU
MGPKVPRRALKFITNRTICTTLVDKILLDGEPSLPAVDAVGRDVEQASGNGQPTAVVAQQPVAAAKLPPLVANAFGETLRAINDDISIIEASPFPMASAPQSPKIGVLREVHLCRGLVIDFPGEEPILSDNDDKE